MPLNARELADLTRAGVIDETTATRITEFFEDAGKPSLTLDITHGAYVLGSILVLWAMGWFMTESFDRFGGFFLAAIAAAYGIVFTLAANTLWTKRNLKLPGGILSTLAAGMIPLATFGILSGLGIWPDWDPENRIEFLKAVRQPRIIVEVAGILAAVIAIRLRPFALLAVPLGYALWGMSIDVAVLVSDPPAGAFDHWVNFEITFLFGLGVIAVAYLYDRRTRADYAGWLYASGALSCFGTFSLTGADNWSYPTIAILGILAGILLERAVLTVFGLLGVLGYLGYLASTVFGDSVFFPLSLIAIGIAIIGAGVWYRANREEIEDKMVNAIPEKLRTSLPRFR